MISATSLNAPSALNKGPQIPMSLENGRIRVDSQKFLVPSLPVSARGISNHHSSDTKRRERSIVNGTAHPSDSNPYSHHHHSLSHSYPSHNLNGLRSSYSPHAGGGGGNNNSPNNSPHNNANSNNQRVSSHHPYSHLNNSPRKDAHSPMYAGEVPGSGGNYSSRSSMPIPCSSPAQASSASPKHSHSPSSGAGGAGGNYSPKLPTGPAMLPPPPSGASELNSLAAAGRLYPGFPPPHPSVAAHLSPAFYAAAAAAAASHPIPYPLFGTHYSPHSHSAAAASAYLDSFHSALINRGPGGEIQIQQRSRSPSPTPSRTHGPYHPHAQPPPQQQHHQQQQQSPHSNHHGPSSQSTSVTSLHNKLIESTSVSSDRHFNGHHNHTQHGGHRQSPSSGQFSPHSPGALGISKGGPLGISGGIMNLPSSRLTNGSSSQKHATQAENLTTHKSTNGYSVQSKPWIEHSGMSDSINRKIAAEMEAKDGRHIQGKDNIMYKEHKHRILTQSPEDMSIMQQQQQSHNNKVSKTLTFASDNNNRSVNNIHLSPNSYPHNINGHLHLQNIACPPTSSSHGILTDSNHSKKQINNNHRQQNTSHFHQPQHQHNHQQQHPTQNQQFLPPSPKKPPTGTHWNFAVPANPASKLDFPPPPPPLNNNMSPSSTLNSHGSSVHEPSKYLNSNKPSNQHHLSVPNSIHCNNTTYLSPGQSAQQHSYPSSPRLPGSGPSTPKSPSVHQVKFSFSSGNSKENINGARNSNKSTRNDSSSSTSSNEMEWPVEQMPILEAFRRGSLIQLANGDLKPIEDLRAEDFIHAAANMPESLRIIHCTVLNIQGDGSNGNSMCKVTMTVGSNLQNQQVVVPSTPEQPFFVLGRGWSSLSPKTTAKLLLLPCSPLAVGDVCITLSKSTNKVTLQPQLPNNGKSQSQVPKSPSVKSKGNGGKYRTNAAIANLKKSQQQAVSTSTLTTNNSLSVQGSQQEGRKAVVSSANDNQQIGILSVSHSQAGGTTHSSSSNSNAIKRSSMGPPLMTTTGASTVLPKPADLSVEKVVMDSLGPPSPKRRRWSAPESEFLPGGDKYGLPNKGKNLTPPPPSVHSVPTEKSNNSFENSKSNKKTDVNSNVDGITPPNAQPAKA